MGKTFKISGHSAQNEPKGKVTERGKLLSCKRCERRARKHDPKTSFVVSIKTNWRELLASRCGSLLLTPVAKPGQAGEAPAQVHWFSESAKVGVHIAKAAAAAARAASRWLVGCSYSCAARTVEHCIQLCRYCRKFLPVPVCSL